MSDAVAPDLTFLEPTFKRAAIVYWAFLWRVILLATGAGVVAGLIEGFMNAAVGLSATIVRLLPSVVGVLVCVPIGIYAVQLVLRKRFGEFTIRLLPTKAEQPN
jgi:hypothetical protein